MSLTKKFQQRFIFRTRNLKPYPRPKGPILVLRLVAPMGCNPLPPTIQTCPRVDSSNCDTVLYAHIYIYVYTELFDMRGQGVLEFDIQGRGVRLRGCAAGLKLPRGFRVVVRRDVRHARHETSPSTRHLFQPDP